MTIDEAKETLEDPIYQDLTLHDPKFEAATKLGIEALKEVQKARSGDPALDGELLPGETEE